MSSIKYRYLNKIVYMFYLYEIKRKVNEKTEINPPGEVTSGRAAV